MISSPSPASTRTLPSTSADTSEFVVPRSIPTMTSAMQSSRRRRLIAGDLHLGKPEHPTISRVAGAEHFEHRPRRDAGRGHHLQRPHRPRIEWLALSGDLVDVEPPERIVEPLQSEPVALDEGLEDGALAESAPQPGEARQAPARLLEPAREAVARLQQLGDQLDPRLAPSFGEPFQERVRARDVVREPLERRA